MRFLIDTHIFVWFISGSSELKVSNKNLIENDKNEINISIASLWEISIKNALGKLEIKGGYEAVMDVMIKNEIKLLSVNFAHTLYLNKLPFHHKDPFDRMIVSQAIVERMDIISDDKILDLYLDGTSVRRIF